MELKQLRANTQINPPIVLAPAPKRTALDALAQYAVFNYLHFTQNMFLILTKND